MMSADYLADLLSGAFIIPPLPFVSSDPVSMEQELATFTTKIFSAVVSGALSFPALYKF